VRLGRDSCDPRVPRFRGPERSATKVRRHEAVLCVASFCILTRMEEPAADVRLLPRLVRCARCAVRSAPARRGKPGAAPSFRAFQDSRRGRNDAGAATDAGHDRSECRWSDAAASRLQRQCWGGRVVTASVLFGLG
jgi:hypothetical protein